MPELIPVIVGLLAAAASLVLPRLLLTIQNPVEVGAMVLALGLFAMELAPGAVVLGVGLIIGASHLWERWPPLGGLVALAGIVLVAIALPSDSTDWLRVATVGFCVLFGWVGWLGSAASPNANVAQGQLWLWLMTITAAGIYAAVADTEQITAIAVWLVIVAAASQSKILVVAPARLAALLPSVFIFWAAGVGAEGRPAAFAGAVGCFGMLASLAWWKQRSGRFRNAAPPWPWVLVLHLGVVAVASRVAGIGTDVQTSWLITAGLGVAVAAATITIARTGAVPSGGVGGTLE